MSYMKRHAEAVSEALGYGGEINDVVSEVASRPESLVVAAAPHLLTVMEHVKAELWELEAGTTSAIYRMVHDACELATTTQRERENDDRPAT